MSISDQIVGLLRHSSPCNLVTNSGNVLVDAQWESIADIADALGVDAEMLANDLSGRSDSPSRDKFWVTGAKDVPGSVVVLYGV